MGKWELSIERKFEVHEWSRKIVVKECDTHSTPILKWRQEEKVIKLCMIGEAITHNRRVVIFGSEKVIKNGWHNYYSLLI